MYFKGLPENDVFLFMKIIFILANSADPDEMPPYAAFHLDLHCLPKNLFTGIQNEMGYTHQSSLTHICRQYQCDEWGCKAYLTFLHLIKIEIPFSRHLRSRSGTANKKYNHKEYKNLIIQKYNLYVFLFDLILSVPSTIFQLTRDGSS